MENKINFKKNDIFTCHSDEASLYFSLVLFAWTFIIGEREMFIELKLCVTMEIACNYFHVYSLTDCFILPEKYN